ncbi:MAG TPA: cytochrome c biogenesis protein ResB [Dehalococcoidia bacterium]|nr:cytochrome c biogenesis protein ResB [Dehalococcoidia bacterium]
MALPSAKSARPALSLTGPLRTLWWLLQSPRWAAVVTGVVALVALLGVLLPQLPFWARGDPAAEAAWLAQQRERFGPAAEWLWRLGLLDLFHAPWFAVALGLLVTSTVAYVVGRLPGIWAGIVRPRLRVPDSYFDTAPHRLRAAAAADVDALERALRRSLYRVVRFPEGAVTYLFADRFPWAAFGTLLGHGAVALFVIAAAVGSAGTFDTALLVAEGQSRPVLPTVASPRQMLVKVEDATGRFDPQGTPLDYRTQLVIYRQGEEVKRCQVTVNSPCSYDGYRFYQAAYFGYGAEVQVRDMRSGDVLYRETLALEFQRPAPFVRARDASGNVLFEGTVPVGEPLRLDLGQGPTDVSLAYLMVGGHSYLLGLWQAPDQGPRLLVASGDPSGGVVIGEGGRAAAGGLEWELVRVDQVPAARVTGFPLPPGREGDSALLQMTDVAYGTANASEGGRVPVAGLPGMPTLYLLGVSERPLALRPGQSAQVGDYEYTFVGQREFAGIQVRRDRSDTLVWVATGLLMAGLLMALWLPRRRLWMRIGPTETKLAVQGWPEVGLRREMERLLARAGVRADSRGGEDA